uniref:Uncharacterized protein n=1 Tax=Magnetococcus massalia (strain MO-1) TaxID=451514 RepID=A0A1S7LJL5_MAGMO|nr:protein of unknown function [Candidatus Magnetococcus massalia]
MAEANGVFFYRVTLTGGHFSTPEREVDSVHG